MLILRSIPGSLIAACLVCCVVGWSPSAGAQAPHPMAAPKPADVPVQSPTISSENKKIMSPTDPSRGGTPTQLSKQANDKVMSPTDPSRGGMKSQLSNQGNNNVLVPTDPSRGAPSGQ